MTSGRSVVVVQRRLALRVKEHTSNGRDGDDPGATNKKRRSLLLQKLRALR